MDRLTGAPTASERKAVYRFYEFHGFVIFPPMAAYALTIFTGAFLLFQVQPLIGKYILPWFGGGPGVWTTCMLFFQMLLLCGYAYAHVSTRYLRPRAQVFVHLALLVAGLALLPIVPSEIWKPQGGGNPIIQILLLLGVTIGLPYFGLSATGPLIQHWFSRAKPGVSPYRLYSLSNLGSLLALLTYPFYFETHFPRITQARLWGWGFAAYTVCCAVCGYQLWKLAPPAVPAHSEPRAGDFAKLPARDQFLWLLLPACASILLLATTNKLCLDVAVFPFLWVAPLAIYLLTFIICFDSPRWYVRVPFTLALIAAMAALCWALFKASDWTVAKQIGVYCGALFVCCMMCHGELYRLKPPPEHLTRYYLMIAAGGALGGSFVAVAAPLFFKDYYELHWGLLLCAALFVYVCATDREPARPAAEGAPTGSSPWRWLGCALPLLAFAALDWFLRDLSHQVKSVPKVGFLALRLVMWTLLGAMAASWIIRGKFREFRFWRALTCIWLFLGTAALAVTLWMHARDSGSERIYRARNFYGVLSLYEHNRSDPLSRYFLLQHGRITHGLQFADPEQAKWPVSYYGPGSGIALAVEALPKTPRRLGVVGLGAGTMASHGRPGDYARIYEIDPHVVAIASTQFHYLANFAANGGKYDIVLGDARLSLEKESPQRFDLIALDAFSSDAIPVHLLTREAFEVYERHLNPNGIIAVHISNHYLDLEPVVVQIARAFQYEIAAVDYDDSDNEGDWWLYSSTWVLLSHSADVLHDPAIQAAAYTIGTNSMHGPFWTDDFASLFPIIRKKGD
jgi:spermidine synthase